LSHYCLRDKLGSDTKYYEGISGVKYFDWQNRNGDIAGKIEARKFQAYVKPTDTVVDFGCGAGHVLRNLSCHRRIGIDVNPSALKAASKVGIECFDSIDQVSDRSCDVIISNHALEHVTAPIAALRLLLQKLKPIGTLAVCVPVDDWRTQRRYKSDDINHHLYTWTPQLLGNCLFEAGFQPSKFSIRLLTHAWFPGARKLYGNVPAGVFDRLCTAYAIVSKRRQLMAVATTDSHDMRAAALS
jgi:SAM-dependent methyltransferase